MTLAELHDIVQVATGWTDTHLHEFEIGNARYGTPDPDWDADDIKDEARAKLSRLAAAGSKFRYTYDFGDGWRHDITVAPNVSPVRHPVGPKQL